MLFPCLPFSLSLSLSLFFFFFNYYFYTCGGRGTAMSRAGGADRRSIVIANANAARSLRARRSQRNVYCCLLHVCVSVAAGYSVLL